MIRLMLRRLASPVIFKTPSYPTTYGLPPPLREAVATPFILRATLLTLVSCLHYGTETSRPPPGCPSMSWGRPMVV
jgi:hypothetical protein